jgi:hypothetical protein
MVHAFRNLSCRYYKIQELYLRVLGTGRFQSEIWVQVGM